MNGLLDRQVAFLGALRRAGVAVSLAESVDAARAVATVGVRDRAAFRAALAATTVKRATARPAFDALFDVYFPAVLGDPADAAETSDADGLREELRAALAGGSDADLARLARIAVSLLGRVPAGEGRQSFFAYRVLSRLSPETLLAGLLDDALADRPRGGLAEQVARHALRERIQRFRELVEAEVRRRVLADTGRLAVGEGRGVVESVEFLRASRAELTELRRQVYPLARRLATRLTSRRRLGRAGRLDFRRTVRALLSTGGVPVSTRHRPKRPHRPELVLMCDLSSSVAAFAHFTLLLAYALRDQFARVRAFGFVDTTDEVTGYFAGAADVLEAVERLSRQAQVVRFDGRSDYGNAFAVLSERWPDAVGPRTSLLVLGDARNNYRSLGLPALKGLAGRARHTYWLNPEPRRYWGTGDSVAGEYGALVPMVECRDVAQLEQFIAGLG